MCFGNEWWYSWNFYKTIFMIGSWKLWIRYILSHRLIIFQFYLRCVTACFGTAHWDKYLVGNQNKTESNNKKSVVLVLLLSTVFKSISWYFIDQKNKKERKKGVHHTSCDKDVVSTNNIYTCKSYKGSGEII